MMKGDKGVIGGSPVPTPTRENPELHSVHFIVLC